MDQGVTHQSGGADDVAHFILTRLAREVTGKITLRHVFHERCKLPQWAADTAAHDPANTHDDGKGEKRQQHNGAKALRIQAQCHGPVDG